MQYLNGLKSIIMQMSTLDELIRMRDNLLYNNCDAISPSEYSNLVLISALNPKDEFELIEFTENCIDRVQQISGCFTVIDEIRHNQTARTLH